MKMQRLHIEMNTYGPREGQYECQVTYQGRYDSEVKLQLSPELTNRVLAIIAEELVKSSRMVADDLTAEVIQAAAQLPAPGATS